MNYRGFIVRLCVAVTAVVFSVFLTTTVHAQNACEQSCTDKESCQKKSDECSRLINESKGQQQTLAATITFLNNKIKLTQNQIFQTEIEINQLEKEIGTLEIRIDGLEVSLTRLTQVLIDRVQDEYKQKNHQSMFLLLTTNGFSDAVARYKYMKLSQDYTQKLMHDAESQKAVYGEEKLNKEKKQAEVEALKKKLLTQQTSLAEQEKQKQSLLSATQNDEKKYQQLKIQAEAQLRAFSNYVQSQGGSGILSGQTKCDGWGCYYNQRDSQWGNSAIGSSSYAMKDAGCLVTSMAMISTHYGKNLTPGDIAGSPNLFSGVLLLQGTWSVNGVSMSRSPIGYGSNAMSALDAELGTGRPAIVGLYSGPDHFIVIKEKKDGEYIMHDPFVANGNDKKFTDEYPLSAIRRVDRVSVN